jgi:hypothetical protein
MNNMYSEILIWAMRSSYVLPILFFLIFRFHGINRKTAIGIFIYSSVVCLVEIYFEVVPLTIEYGIIGINTYSILYPIIILYTYKVIFDKRSEKLAMSIMLALFIAFSIINFLLYGFLNLLPYGNIIGLTLIIFASIFYLYKTFSELKVQNLFLYLPFWFSASFLFHTAATFFLSLFQEVILLDDAPEYQFLWEIQYYTAILFNLMISLGLWKTRVQ